jgi:SAM-dependent methyltransferase
VEKLFERYYDDYDPLYLARKVRLYSSPESVVLDLGAGSSNSWPHGLRGSVRRLVGIDPSDQIIGNNCVDEAVVGRSEELPFRDDSFDIVLSHNVVEHLANPLSSFREIARVLKPGGVVLLQTPNFYYYAIVASQLTPHWFHRFFVGRLGTRVSVEEVFPTFYRLNTARAVRRLMATCGLQVVELELLSGPPGYLRFSPIAFMLGVFYQRTVENFFPSLRKEIVAIARKAVLPQPGNV